jgi:hypothetical protein
MVRRDDDLAGWIRKQMAADEQAGAADVRSQVRRARRATSRCAPITPAAAAVEIEGTTRWMRSEVPTGAKPCLCHPDGSGHVFCYTVDLEPWANRYGTGDQDSTTWLHRAIEQMPEGARIRIRVEIVA